MNAIAGAIFGLGVIIATCFVIWMQHHKPPCKHKWIKKDELHVEPDPDFLGRVTKCDGLLGRQMLYREHAIVYECTKCGKLHTVRVDNQS